MIMMYILCAILLGLMILALVVAIAAAILEIMFPFILAAAVIAFICWAVRRLSGSRRSRYWRY